jgi:hypothetical protein
MLCAGSDGPAHGLGHKYLPQVRQREAGPIAACGVGATLSLTVLRCRWLGPDVALVTGPVPFDHEPPARR